MQDGILATPCTSSEPGVLTSHCPGDCTQIKLTVSASVVGAMPATWKQSGRESLIPKLGVLTNDSESPSTKNCRIQNPSSESRH